MFIVLLHFTYRKNNNFKLKSHQNYFYPLAELSQCILDSSNGSIINVI